MLCILPLVSSLLSRCVFLRSGERSTGFDDTLPKLTFLTRLGCKTPELICIDNFWLLEEHTGSLRRNLVILGRKNYQNSTRGDPSPMKTIQAVARYFPEQCGGIQVHLSELLPGLQAQGVESKIAASVDESQEDTYNYGGVEVYRYPVFPIPKKEPNYGQFPHGGFEYFARWLKQQKADIYNQHQWTPKCGLPHLRFAKELGMATIVTVHLPHPICQRGTLMLNGQQACDGKIDQVRCSYCCGVPKSVPSSAIKSLSRTPMPVSVMAGELLRSLDYAPAPIKATQVHNKAGGLLRPFSVPAYVAARQYGLVEMVKYADRIVAVCQWLYEALLANGVPKEKLVLCRYGVSDSWQKRVLPLKQQNRPLRVGFLGRWDAVKGIHILVEAVKSLPTDIPIELFIHGVPQDETYRKEIMVRVAEDTRIHIKRQLTREELPSALPNFDVLAVPSQWLETGPLVVLEAHALGIPVVGSDLGGIAELIPGLFHSK